MDAMKVLVTGWFSFVDGEATAGDLLAREVACGWLERDGPTTRRPDLAFATSTEAVPVVGLILGHPQPEYGERGAHDATHATILRVLRTRKLCMVPFDTRVDPRAEDHADERSMMEMPPVRPSTAYLIWSILSSPCAMRACSRISSSLTLDLRI